jgi:hypothetical protein
VIATPEVEMSKDWQTHWTRGNSGHLDGSNTALEAFVNREVETERRRATDRAFSSVKSFVAGEGYEGGAITAFIISVIIGVAVYKVFKHSYWPPSVLGIFAGFGSVALLRMSPPFIAVCGFIERIVLIGVAIIAVIAAPLGIILSLFGLL